MQTIPELGTHGLRKFGLTFASIIAGLFGLVLPWVFSFAYPTWPWVVSVILVLWGLLAPDTLNLFYRIWMRFGLLLNAVMSRVILGILFFGIITPTGWIMRFAGRDPLTRKRDPEAMSYRTASRPRTPSHMERPF
jgi:predicted membrane protein